MPEVGNCYSRPPGRLPYPEDDVPIARFSGCHASEQRSFEVAERLDSDAVERRSCFGNVCHDDGWDLFRVVAINRNQVLPVAIGVAVAVEGVQGPRRPWALL